MRSVAKAWAFLAAMSLTLIVLGHHYGGREGLLFALTVALGINSFVYFYEDRRVLSLFQGRELEGQDSFGLREMARRLAVKCRVPTPRIVLLESNSPQAGVVGRGITHGTIILTNGCLEKFSHAEIEAIIAYQIANIRLLNTLTFAVGSFIMSFSLFITETLDAAFRLLLVEKRNPQFFISNIITRITAPFIGFILRLSIRPSFYQAADTLAAQLIGDPKMLATALWKLESYAETLPFTVPMSTAHMFAVSPLTTLRWARYFIAQPRPSERIRKIIGYYPV
ncbi:MAG: hypothetical protein A2Z20_07195 [Bdellovibrionales bacterium RBG_16_40_8]|nr:MAG: hypothetical protein A2Z20_07195 [Bdellovibrionales bacterium RBG_16_40_8]